MELFLKWKYFGGILCHLWNNSMLINHGGELQASLLIKSKKRVKPEYGLPSFCWDDVTLERELDSGAFGTVYLGNYACTRETVVKKLRGESGDGKRRFIKEGQILNDLKGHRNISQFSAFCDRAFCHYDRVFSI